VTFSLYKPFLFIFTFSSNERVPATCAVRRWIAVTNSCTVRRLELSAGHMHAGERADAGNMKQPGAPEPGAGAHRRGNVL
jgi:hypothetical protein